MIYVSNKCFTFVLLLCCFFVSRANGSEGEDIPRAINGFIDQAVARTAYSGDESFIYDVSWSGGIKIGELYLSVEKSESCSDCYRIDSTITTSGGIIHRLYPIEDRHLTYVRGRERLPYFSEIWQKQGKNYTAHKKISYDQEKFIIKKEKDGDPEITFQVEGVVHNEFSSFFSSRVMDLRKGGRLIVPTFGDDKRCEVTVEIEDEEVVEDTILGNVTTLRVMPILTFSGLYDKRGDTIIWYTNDECRVPVLIHSKIVIGSLTATLADFTNPHCQRYPVTGGRSVSSHKKLTLRRYTKE